MASNGRASASAPGRSAGWAAHLVIIERSSKKVGQPRDTQPSVPFRR